MNRTRRAVLRAIEDGPVAGPDLADRLEISRAAVWKHVEALRSDGVTVESGPDGYTIGAVTGYGAAAIQAGLDTPFAIEFHEAIDSTNERARALADGGAEDLCVIAERQTGGRGRLDREWSSPAGGVWMSVLTRPDLPPGRVPLLTLAAAVAVTRASRDAGVDAWIKWPNDVVVPDDSIDRGYAKLAGILTAMEGETDRVEWVVVGMGINANVDGDALPPGATSIRDRVGDVDRRAFVQSILAGYDDRRSALDGVLAEWRDLALTIGQRVRVDTGGDAIVGEAVDVTETGALELETADGRHVVQAGDCEHLRPAD